MAAGKNLIQIHKHNYCYSYTTAIHKINVHECSHERSAWHRREKIAYDQVLFPFKFPCVCICDLKCKITFIVDDDDGVIEVFNRINIFRTNTVWVREFVCVYVCSYILIFWQTAVRTRCRILNMVKIRPISPKLL